ncbi:transketolase [Desulfoprunum benzoelyticum]|uniref:Transketolase C-terminal domain/subunit/transketolase N-terminal domain/subunit n=1 Tax=Desulfoprunum benzoelyticum TaxID=1506996 RepID=A0A840UPQ5_9BACT|nr:transketolase C-terminal domain-containing protein [Desulfoprunum benzoelyticum]MBB5348227.1 transketolase C-terminal domain/subunit/transketolase N-terminal domain/subunit [Desulfoprunum benzoelyticum]MBM9529581.1 transketolase [Desulfoprunum benzoelyticum]
MFFPIDLHQFVPQRFPLNQTTLTDDERRTLLANIKVVRDSLIFFTAYANAKGLGGHTGGAYDIVPELLIIDAFMKGNPEIHPVHFDEAGHRVAIQYMMAVLNGYRDAESLLHYREYGHGYYGHPERDDAGGVFFSSGRLGHLWSYVNGVAEADPAKILVLFGSDGSQMEGDDAEAARYAVARNLKVKLFIDDNDVTIAGHPSQYMAGYDVARTLAGHGLTVDAGDGEDLDALFARISRALAADGPAAVISRRPMAVGVPGIEGLPKGHDVIPVNLAVDYLQARGYSEAVALLQNYASPKTRTTYLGSTPETAKNRDDFGKIVCDILAGMDERSRKVIVVDSDLEGSCGLHHIRKNFPEVYVHAGIMERNNFSVAAGFGSEPGRQGIFGTFAAFLEMVVSEITMARLNNANVLAHFSHSGVDDMADNTCHFGINNFFADNALAEGDLTRLYFPADALQLKAVLPTIFNDPGLRFVFSTRSATPFILKENGDKFYGDGYVFTPGRDEIIRRGTAGYVVSYGEMLYRCLDAVEQLRAEGIDVGLINKTTLNACDEEMLAAVGAGPFALIVESQNTRTGLGIRYGTWLLERGYAPKYAAMGTSRPGHGGLDEQLPHQGLAVADIKNRITTLIGA